MTKIAGYQVHPLAEVFPMIEGDEFDAFVADIKNGGLKYPIVLHEGKILDGRNRARACVKARVDIKTKNYNGGDPVGYVISANLVRRHLDTSQRAMVADELATMTHGGDRKTKAEISALKQEDAAALLKVDRRSVQHARKVREKADPELVNAVKQGHVAVSAAAKVVDRPKADQKKLAREAKKGKKPAKIIRELKDKDRVQKNATKNKNNKKLGLPEQVGVLLADPPWQYSAGTTTPSRKIENHYPTMPTADICKMPVKNIVLDDCMLFLWATSPLLPDALQVMEAWGFEYKTSMVWHKKGGSPGMGYYVMVDHEFVLIGVRGDPVKPKMRPSSVIVEAKSKHSAKPTALHKHIEKMYPKLTLGEMFARKKFGDRWLVFGNEV